MNVFILLVDTLRQSIWCSVFCGRWTGSGEGGCVYIRMCIVTLDMCRNAVYVYSMYMVNACHITCVHATHNHMYVHIHTHTPMCTHTLTHTRTHTRTHAHTHTHTHTHSLSANTLNPLGRPNDPRWSSCSCWNLSRKIDNSQS